MNTNEKTEVQKRKADIKCHSIENLYYKSRYQEKPQNERLDSRRDKQLMRLLRYYGIPKYLRNETIEILVEKRQKLRI